MEKYEIPLKIEMFATGVVRDVDGQMQAEYSVIPSNGRVKYREWRNVGHPTFVAGIPPDPNAHLATVSDLPRRPLPQEPFIKG